MTTFDALASTTQHGLSEFERMLLLACNSGGSGRGMSFWSTAASCGRRAQLDEKRAERLRIVEMPPPETPGYYIVGSVYHRLQDLWRSDPAAIPDGPYTFTDANVAEGMRLFQGWASMWPADFWGEVLAAEVTLPVRSEAAVLDAFRGNMVNAKPDMVVWMDQAACRRAEQRGIHGLTEGAYIVDWKSSSNIRGAAEQYTGGLQATWYPTAWNLEHPDQPVKGIIFDVISKKHKSFGENAFAAHFAPAPTVAEGVARIRGMVTQGARNIASGDCNAAACRDWRGATCPYLGREGGCA